MHDSVTSRRHGTKMLGLTRMSRGSSRFKYFVAIPSLLKPRLCFLFPVPYSCILCPVSCNCFPFPATVHCFPFTVYCLLLPNARFARRTYTVQYTGPLDLSAGRRAPKPPKPLVASAACVRSLSCSATNLPELAAPCQLLLNATLLSIYLLLQSN
jgi:hypothetical protein